MIQENKNSELVDKEITNQKQSSKLINALLIGFLAGIIVTGLVAWIIAKKTWGIVPMIAPIFIIYLLVKKKKTVN